MNAAAEHTLLLVEDEAIIALNRKTQLEKNGYNVITVSTAQEAVTTALKNTAIDLVLMDIDLGRGQKDGTEAAAEILKSRTLPIIFLSSHTEPEIVNKTKEITSYGYVVKNSAGTILTASIEMAFTLFYAHQQIEEHQNQLKHTNRILYSITDINHLMTRIDDRDELLAEACRTLVKTNGYDNVWYAGVKEGKPVPPWYHAGLTEKEFCSIEASLVAEPLPRCIAAPVNSGDVVIISDPKTQCSGCPFYNEHTTGQNRGKDLTIITSPVAHGERMYGLITVAVYTEFVQYREELKLIETVARDLGYALHKIEIEKNQTDTIEKMKIQDNSEQHRIRESLRESKRRLEYVLEGTHAGIWEWNVQTGETIFNERWAEIIGYTLEELSPVSLETWKKFVHPDDLSVSERISREHFSGSEEYYEVQVRMRHKDGRWIWILDRGKVATWTDDGQPEWMYGTHQDITEIKSTEMNLIKAVEEKDMLMKEFNHRVKNNLMMISSLVRLKSAALDDTVDLSDLENRINAIRLIHDKLLYSVNYSDINVPDYLRDLLKTLFSMTTIPVSIECNSDIEKLPTRTVITLGLIVNEIATNAVKHGFSEKEKNLFTLELSEKESPLNYRLVLSNSGKPFPDDIDPDSPKSLGLQLISTLVNQLQGTLNLSRHPHPVFTIAFRSSEL